MPRRRSTDRVVIKGLGMHFRGEGRPALWVTFGAIALFTLVILLTVVGGGYAVQPALARVIGRF